MEHGPAPRTRPEGQQFAAKNKETNDWFRHEGRETESPAPPPSRTGSRPPSVAASQKRGKSGDWYRHPENGHVNGWLANNVGTRTKRPGSGVRRCPTSESKRNFQKIKGTDEAWYKHEDNKAYVSPRPKSRLAGADAQEAKTKIMGNGSNWYKYGEAATNGVSPPRSKSRLGSANAAQNAHRLRPTGTPDWATHNGERADATDGGVHLRLSQQAVGFHEKNKGSAGEWFSHASNGTESNGTAELLSPRRGSEESQMYAQKLKGESGNWFNHDANKDYVEPAKASRCRSASARDMVERTRGHDLDQVMKHESVNGSASPRSYNNGPGALTAFLGPDDTDSAPKPPRIKPEGQHAANRNKGNMAEQLEGYLDTPRKHGVRRVRPEAEEYARRARGQTSAALSGDLPGSARKHPRIKGDGEKYAQRNMGAGNLIGGMGDLVVTGTPIKHRSKEAEANAARWQGSEMNSVFCMGD